MSEQAPQFEGKFESFDKEAAIQQLSQIQQRVVDQIIEMQIIPKEKMLAQIESDSATIAQIADHLLQEETTPANVKIAIKNVIPFYTVKSVQITETYKGTQIEIPADIVEEFQYQTKAISKIVLYSLQNQLISGGALSLLEEIGSGQRTLLENELERSANNWLACVNTRINVISMCVGLMDIEQSISDSDYDIVAQNLKNLTKEIAHMFKDFSVRGQAPEENIQHRIYSELRMYADEAIARSEGTFVEGPRADTLDL